MHLNKIRRKMPKTGRHVRLLSKSANKCAEKWWINVEVDHIKRIQMNDSHGDIRSTRSTSKLERFDSCQMTHGVIMKGLLETLHLLSSLLLLLFSHIFFRFCVNKTWMEAKWSTTTTTTTKPLISTRRLYSMQIVCSVLLLCNENVLWM